MTLELFATVQECAKALGMPERTLQRWRAESVVPSDSEDRVNVIAVAQKLLNDARGKVSRAKGTDEISELKKEKLAAEVALLKEKAAYERTRVKELAGVLVRADETHREMTDFLMVLRARFLSLPNRLAVEVAYLSDPMEVDNRITFEVHDILTELAKYESPDEIDTSYDPYTDVDEV